MARNIITKRGITKLSFETGKTHYYCVTKGRYVLGIIKITPRKFLMELVDSVNKNNEYELTRYDWYLSDVYGYPKYMDKNDYIPFTYRFKEVTLKDYNVVKKDFDKNAFFESEGGDYI